MSNAFNEAMDEAEEEQDDISTAVADFDVDEFLSGLGKGPKDKTIGIAVDEETKAVWDQLREDDSVEIDVAESIRDHIVNLANRHQKAAEKAGRKLEIEREL